MNSSAFRFLCVYLLVWPSLWGWYYIGVQMPPKGTHLYFMGYLAALIVTVTLFLGLLTRDRHKPASLSLDRKQGCALLLFLVAALVGPMLNAPEPAYAYIRMLLLLPLALGGFAAYIWFQTLENRQIVQLALAFISGMLLHALLVIPFLQPFIDAVELVWTSGIVPFYNVRRYTNYFAVAIPVMTGLWVWAYTYHARRGGLSGENQRCSNGSSALLAGFTLGALCIFWAIQFWAGSRAPTLAVLCAITVMALVAREYCKPLIIGSSIGFVSGAFISVFLPRPTPFFGFWSRMFEFERYESLNRLGSGRLGVWKEAWRQFTESPLFGNGHAQFMLQDGPIGRMPVETPHNFPLEMLNDFGLIGGLSILFLIYGGVLKLLHRMTRQTLSPVTVMCMLALLTMSAQSLFDGNISSFLSIVPFGLFWALAAASVKRDALHTA